MSTQGRAQFTPGPWRVINDKTIVGADYPGQGYVADVNLHRNSDAQEVDGQANATLIAAAPAMYEALSMAHNVLYMLKQGFPSEALCSENNPWGQDTGTLPDGKKVSRSAYMKKADEATAVALSQAEGR